MKSSWTIGVIVVVLLIVAGGVLLFTGNGSQADTGVPQAETVTQVTPTVGTAVQADSGRERYVPFTEAAFAAAVSGRRVLFFYASWCPTCRPADADLQQRTADIPADVTVIRVNYNDPDTDQEEKELARTYGITYQHTFVQIDAAGKKVTTWNGGQTAELLSNIK